MAGCVGGDPRATAKQPGGEVPQLLVIDAHTFPEVVPNCTVMEFVFVPAVIVAPAGSVQA